MLPDLTDDELCAALRRFATAHGVPGKYRHDLTLDHLDRIERRMRAGRYSTSGEFLRDNPELLDWTLRPAASPRPRQGPLHG